MRGVLFRDQWGAAQGSVVRTMCGVLLRDMWCEQCVGCCSGISGESNVWGAAQGSVVRAMCGVLLKDQW